MEQNRRPSVYLEERCANLDQVLDFFLAPSRGQGGGPGAEEMLVVFLSQLGFWEWELDNLIYAFTTFDERAKAWRHENGHGLATELKNVGIWVRVGAVKDLKVKRQARSGRRAGVFAPVKELNHVVAKWNGLLDLCERKVLAAEDDRAEAVRLGAQLLPDLSKFRKAELPVPVG